jgi:hypothetical protein
MCYYKYIYSIEKLLEWCDNKDFQISAAHCPVHHTPQGMLHEDTQLSGVLVSDIWTPITYKLFSAYCIMLGLGMFETELKNSQIGNGFKALPLVYCEIPYGPGWTKGTSCYLWPLRIYMPPARERQRDCLLLGQSFHTWHVWRGPWTAGEDYRSIYVFVVRL